MHDKNNQFLISHEQLNKKMFVSYTWTQADTVYRYFAKNIFPCHQINHFYWALGDL